MYRFAQTNIQLFNQLYDLGCAEEEIAVVKQSYEVAMVLFTGRFRGSGKTFIAHSVGTASILASLRLAPSVVAAGLLHAAYDSGDFGQGGQGLSSAKREYMRVAVGTEVEEYIAGYTELRWDLQVAENIYVKLDSLNQFERDVLLIRLANELEDYLDLGILFCGTAKRDQSGYHNSSGRILYNLALRLGYSGLADALKTELERTDIAAEEPRFKTIGSRDFSFLMPPLSYKRLMDAVAKRLNETPNGRKDQL